MSEDHFAKGLIALTLMRQAVQEHMLPAFQNPQSLTIETKLDKTIVTNVDRAVEEFLTVQLAEQFPGDTIIGEGSTIGANVFLTHSVPPRSLVFYEENQLRILDKNKRPEEWVQDWVI